jgi:hypothetical protein
MVARDSTRCGVPHVRCFPSIDLQATIIPGGPSRSKRERPSLPRIAPIATARELPLQVGHVGERDKHQIRACPRRAIPVAGCGGRDRDISDAGEHRQVTEMWIDRRESFGFNDLRTSGAWRSPVARLLWEQEVAGSNPVAPSDHKSFLLHALRRGMWLDLNCASWWKLASGPVPSLGEAARGRFRGDNHPRSTSSVGFVSAFSG